MDGCRFNRGIKENIYQLYMNSNLQVLEYLAEITGDRKYIDKYLSQKEKRENVFNECMSDYGLCEYIKAKDLGYEYTM